MAVSQMAEIVAEGVVQGYSETPWNMTDERTGEKRNGISRKLKVRLAEPGSGTLIVKVPEDMADEADALDLKATVALTLDIDRKGIATLSDVQPVAAHAGL